MTGRDKLFGGTPGGFPLGVLAKGAGQRGPLRAGSRRESNSKAEDDEIGWSVGRRHEGGETT